MKFAMAMLRIKVYETIKAICCSSLYKILPYFSTVFLTVELMMYFIHSDRYLNVKVLMQLLKHTLLDISTNKTLSLQAF